MLKGSLSEESKCYVIKKPRDKNFHEIIQEAVDYIQRALARTEKDGGACFGQE